MAISDWGHAQITVSPRQESAWGYAPVTVEDRLESPWGYAPVSVVSLGAPLLRVAGQDVNPDWAVMTGGIAKPVRRWQIVNGGLVKTLIHRSGVWVPPQHYAGAAPVGSTSYPIPGSGVIYLATSGSDANNGLTTAAPRATLAAAVAAVPAGGTIIVREGIYYQGELNIAKAVTIQNYHGEQVWFDGTIPFPASWTGSGPWTAPYTITWDRLMGKTAGQIGAWTGAATRFVVDQVWLDNTPLAATADGTSSPGAGNFSVNQTTDTLTIGSNPAGKTVRVGGLKYLLHATAPIMLRGIGIRRYVQASLEWQNGAVMLSGNGSVLEEVTIEHCSLACLSTYSENNIIRRSTFQNAGQTGVHCSKPNGMVFTQNVIRRINRLRYDPEPTTAGIKIGLTWYGCEISHNHISDVSGAYGIWTDTAVSEAVIYANTVIGTAVGDYARMKNGIEIEASDGMLLAGVRHWNYVIANRVTDCNQAALLILISGYIKSWNNHLAGGVALYCWQDFRQNSGSKPATEGTIEQSPWHTTNLDIVNNALVPMAPWNTQLRGSCNADSPFKLAGGAMFERIARNWFQPPGGGLMAYLSTAAGTEHSNRSSLAALAALGSAFGGPMAPKMVGNHEGPTPPEGSGLPIPADIAERCGIPTGWVPPIGPIWPAVIPIG